MKRTVCIIALILAMLCPLVFVSPVYATEGPTVELDGVQIRLAGSHGLRFIAKVSGAPEDYDEVGILAIPAEYLTGELTLDTEDAVKISNLDEGFKYFDSDENSFRYTLCFINITHELYARQYVVRPYVVYTPDGGTQQTIYGSNSDDYIGSTAEYTEKILEYYADNYTGDEKDMADHETVDDLYTEYNLWLDSLVPPAEDTESEEPEVVDVVTLNEWYWKLGTITSTTGIENEGNHKRIYTPGYIPVNNTYIEFDGASGIKYIVMEYDADKKFLSTSGWITTDTYTVKNETAAYYRCILTNDTTLTVDDIEEMSSHLTVRTPVTTSGIPIGSDEWAVGTLAGATGNYSANTKRVYTPGYYPADRVSIRYDNSEQNTATSAYVVLGYDENYGYVGTSQDNATTTFEKADKIAGSVYYRFVLKTTGTVTSSTVGDFSKYLTVTVNEDVKHTFLEKGSLDASGAYAASDVNAYNSYYIPADVKFTYNTSMNFTYSVSYYDSAKAFISKTAEISDADSPEVPENAAYFRVSVTPGFAVSHDNLGYIGFAFEFLKPTDTADWAVGTISGTTGADSLGRTDRAYTPAYYSADNIKITYDTTNSEVTAYVVLAYDADKGFIKTTGDSKQASFTKWVDGAAYYRFALKAANSGVSTSTIGSYVDCITVYYDVLPVEKYTPGSTAPTLESLYDEGLLYRSAVSVGHSELASGVGGIGGMTVVGDEIWVFAASDTGSVGYGLILRYSFDLVNKKSEYIGSVKHDFGHANSVDYNENTDCLTLGNGSSKFWNGIDSATDNEFYVYQNVSETVKAGAEMISVADENCITYEWKDTGITYMTKLNSCWYGDSSIFVNANNNGHVYKIALGTGDRVLKYGTAKENVAADEFNGTWDIIKHYAQADNYDNAQASGYNGQGYDRCNQGTCYADGRLILNLGHDGVYIWRCRLDSDGTIKRDEFHKYMVVNGAAKTGSISGVDRYEDYIIFTNGGYINVYLNDVIK